jgi:hypothetical protein
MELPDNGKMIKEFLLGQLQNQGEMNVFNLIGITSAALNMVLAQTKGGGDL